MNNKGVALIITFIFMVSLVIIAAAYLFMVSCDTRNVSAQINNDKALYLADAGLNKARVLRFFSENSDTRRARRSERVLLLSGRAHQRSSAPISQLPERGSPSMSATK